MFLLARCFHCNAILGSVYGEVGTALPLNGGTYTVLLNTTTKVWISFIPPMHKLNFVLLMLGCLPLLHQPGSQFVAALAAALTLLSYVATAVVSASSAAEYMVAVSTSSSTVSCLVMQ